MAQTLLQSKPEIKEHDHVQLTEAIAEHQLEIGDSGVVVTVYKEGLGYEVEFFGEGYTIAVLTLTASQVEAIPQAVGTSDEF